MKKALIIIVILGVSVGIFLNRGRFAGLIDDARKPDLPEAVDYSDVVARGSNDPRSNLNDALDEAPAMSGNQRDDTIAASPPEAAPRNDNEGVPSSYNLAVPFQSQAPRANWELPYQEACEEASLIMASAFFRGLGLTADQMDAEIKKLVDWQVRTFGYYEDTTANEVARMADEYFGLSTMVTSDITVENIKRQIAGNKLVIVPAAGKILPNPNFSNGGPIYHMLVIRGYTDTHFITNDPGTKRGEAFLYAYDVLIDAIHDWPSYALSVAEAMDGKPTEEDMLTGRKVMIVLDKQLNS